MNKLFLALLLTLLSPWVVSAGGAMNHEKPAPPTAPAPSPPRCSCWWQPAGAALLTVSPFLALGIYYSKDEKGREKKVEVVPTDHGATIAAKLVF